MKDHISFIVLIELGLIDPSLITVSDPHKFAGEIVVLRITWGIPPLARGKSSLVWGKPSQIILVNLEPCIGLAFTAGLPGDRGG